MVYPWVLEQATLKSKVCPLKVLIDHKRLWQIFPDFDSFLPHVGSYSIGNVGNFCPIFPPSLLGTADVFYVLPLSILRILVFLTKVQKSKPIIRTISGKFKIGEPYHSGKDLILVEYVRIFFKKNMKHHAKL